MTYKDFQICRVGRFGNPFFRIIFECTVAYLGAVAYDIKAIAFKGALDCCIVS